MTFYSEYDRHKAAWLRELIKAGEISNGDVDERSITDIRGDELPDGRLHFFAGIGVWDYSMRLAGWPDEWPVWTASCPCQPFSSAGRRKGTADERHLWPWLVQLIRERRPYVVIGEQVSSPDGLAWFDDVRADLEAAGYACGALDTCAAGVGAPHPRQRLYWCGLRVDGLANAFSKSVRVRGVEDDAAAGALQANIRERERVRFDDGTGGDACRLADAPIAGLPQRDGEQVDGRQGGGALNGSQRLGATGGLGNADSERCDGKRVPILWRGPQQASAEIDRSGATRGHWAGADWVLTRPQRVGDFPGLRPTQPGTFPLADGAPERVGRLRGYGDAIVAPQAAAFVRCVMEEIMEAAR